MRILALDTTTKRGSLALWRDGLVEERMGDAARSHAERLPGDLVALLDAHGVTLADVDRYAVACGPGSFTGLRVGIATIQGLALVHDRLVVPVSALEALARHAAREAALDAGALVGGWMEAYRGEVFGALYRVQAPAGEPGPLPTVEALVEPRVAGPSALADAWRPFLNAGAILVAGDAVAATRDGLVGVFGERLATAEPPALAGTIAAIAALEPHRAVRPHAVVPLYVRRPDAELARDRAAAERLLPHSSPS